MIKDRVFIFLIVNAMLVIVGYAMAIFTSGAALETMQWIKGSVLFAGIINLLTLPYTFLKRAACYFQPYFIFGVFLLATAIYAGQPVYSFLRTLTFLIPFCYIFFSLAFLVSGYSFSQVLTAFLYAVHLIYCIPVFCFLVFGQTTSYINLYYISTDPYTSLGFASNHYGWAGCIVLVTGWDLLRNHQGLSRAGKYYLVIMSLIAVYLILASGNRTSWIVLLICTMTVIFFNSRLGLLRKAVLLSIPLGLVIWLSRLPDSAVTNRLQKTYTQMERGESRIARAITSAQYANTNLQVWMTGWGMFSPPASLMKSMHNSYFEVLFGAGLPAFCYFLWHFVILPCKNLYRYFSRQYLFLIPVIIIPFFESNLTGGQFLFFPWFVFTLMTGLYRSDIRTTELFFEKQAQPEKIEGKAYD